MLLEAVQACPDMPELYNTLGLAYDFGNRYDEAQAAYHRAVALAPRNAAFRNNLAASYFRSGKQTAGVAELRRVLESDPDNRTANLNLGSFYLHRKQYPRAVRYFRAAQVERSEDPLALLELTRAYFGAGRAQEARQFAARISRLAGQDARVHFSLGLLLAENGEYRLAADQFEAIPSPERDSSANLNLGMACSKLRQFSSARLAYEEAIRRDPSGPDAYLHLGLDESASGNHGAALDWIAQAHKRAPERSDVSYALAEELIRTRNFDGARALLSTALTRTADDAGLREAWGDLFLNQRRPGDAAPAYLQCLRSEPRRVSARLSLARAYSEMHQSEKAASELRQILSVDSGNAEAKAQLGRLSLEVGQPDAALKWIREALSADPNNASANESLAMLMERQGRPAEARLALEKLVKIAPNNPRFHYLLGRVLSRLQQPEAAKAEFEISRKLGGVGAGGRE